MDIDAPFEANAQLAKRGKPGMRALHNPAMLAEAVVLFDAPPRGLATVAPSMLARLQSIWSCSRKRVSRAKCRRSQTPLACQARSRRQQVMPLPKPSSWGKSSHGIPVCKTNRIPFSAARSSTLGRPPFGDAATVGSSGCNAFHNSMLIFFRAMTHGNAQQSCGDDTVLLAALRKD